jgi:argininosuccinate lyase
MQVLSTLVINPEKMKSSLSIEMLATDLAEYLVRKGVPFRETHHISGQAVKLAEDRQCSMDKLSLKDFKSLHSAFENDVKHVWDFERSIELRNSVGGTSRSSVKDQIVTLRSFLSK